MWRRGLSACPGSRKLSLFVEYQFHRLGVERLHGGQTKVLHHVHRALLVLQEVPGLDVALIGFLGGIDFEDANLRGPANSGYL